MATVKKIVLKNMSPDSLPTDMMRACNTIREMEKGECNPESGVVVTFGNDEIGIPRGVFHARETKTQIIVEKLE